MEPLALAAYVIQYCINRGTPISNLQLQKILYFCQLRSIGVDGRPIMPHANFEAWQFGPVIPDVYFTYCLNGAYPIDTVQNVMNNGQINPPNYIGDVIDECIRRRPWELVALSHRPNGAWERANRQGWRTVISPLDINDDALNFNQTNNRA